MDWAATEVKFNPWVGENYCKGIKGKRLLVLGESHWHNCNKDEECRVEIDRAERHKGLTNSVVKGWIGGSRRSPVSYQVPALFGISEAEFWSDVVFYNYLQTFAGPGAGVRPKQAQWDDEASSDAFRSVLEHFKPDRILVFGKATWLNLPSGQQREDRVPLPRGIGGNSIENQKAWWYGCGKGHRALAMPIIHPSSRHFRHKDWAPTISLWMNCSDH
jgi:hypothetical protein